MRIKEYREKFPNKYRSHTKLNNALRDGVIAKKSLCENCGGDFRVIAHHSDYLKPLDVLWLCEVCHKAWHKENGEGLNGSD